MAGIKYYRRRFIASVTGHRQFFKIIDWRDMWLGTDAASISDGKLILGIIWRKHGVSALVERLPRHSMKQYSGDIFA